MKNTKKAKLMHRPNVAIFVINRHGQILTCERHDYPGSWQLPQGGVEPGEDLEAAVIRELEEEIGTSSGEIIDRLPRKIRYTWPKKVWKDGYCGQEQTFFLFRISPRAKIDPARGPRLTPGLKQEFRGYEYLNVGEFLNRLSGFKKESYTLALLRFNRRLPGIFAK
jgi:putative (di)nucleoside polyphosphate hydrolase